MTRADRRTLVRQLTDEGLSQRQIAARLNVSKDTVRRDLSQTPQASAAGQGSDAPDDAPSREPDDAPEETAADVTLSQPAPPDEVAQDEPAEPVLRLNLARRPRLLAHLTRLVDAGLRGPAVIDDAVAAFADAYWHAVDTGQLRHGEPFQIRAHVRRAP